MKVFINQQFAEGNDRLVGSLRAFSVSYHEYTSLTCSGLTDIVHDNEDALGEGGVIALREKGRPL